MVDTTDKRTTRLRGTIFSLLMAERAGRVLVVDDDEAFSRLVVAVLGEAGYEVRCYASAEAALQGAEPGFDAAVLDFRLPGTNGLALLDALRERSPDLQAVLLSGHGDMGTVIEGLQHGICDWVPKGEMDVGRLQRAVEGAAARTRLVRENRALLDRLSESNRLLRALADISAELLGEAYLDRILARLVTAAKELTCASAGRALLFAPSRAETLVVEVAVGDEAETVRGTRLQLGEGIAALVAERGETQRLRRAREHPSYSHRSDELRADRPGFLCVPLCHGGVRGALSLAGGPADGFSPFAGELAASLARHAAVAVASALHQERSVNFFTHTCEILVSFLESADVHYPGHSRAVAALADMLTRKLGLPDEERRNIHFAALLHDIGKVRVEASILRHRGLLGPEAMARMVEHPRLGIELLRPITLWEGILPAVHSHHERWDGKGYPRGLRGEQIPLGARIIALAEAFDAMTRNPHRPSRSVEQALLEIETCAGTQFDPRLARLFVAEYRQHGHSLKRYRVTPDAT
jgi:putative nucleotidyltransferase with HDIG domain